MTLDKDRSQNSFFSSSFFNNAKADCYRNFGKRNTLTLLKGVFLNRHFRALISLRLCQKINDSNFLARLFLPVFIFIHKFFCNLASIDLPWKTQIQPGLAITHGWGLVISPLAKIESNCTLFNGVTIGRKDKLIPAGRIEGGAPTIEQEVWIGPHAVIVGDIRIGKGSRVAAGAFVTENIPAFSIVVGNPAKIVKTDCIPDVNNKVNLK